MQFNSVEFLFLFLPIFIFAYLATPERLRNGTLVLGSLLFYALGSGGSYWHLGVLVGTCVCTWLLGLALGKGRRWLLVLSLALLTGLLLFFKIYRGGKLLMPGLSFFVFQMAAYLIDVSRGRITAETRLIRYGAQITMFPKLLSGPLMPPAELKRQTWGRGYIRKDFRKGLEKLILGRGMKVILADRVGVLWDKAVILGFDSVSVIFAWLALIAWAMRLYFDFWGYSLMAIGLGQMLGFELPENFRDPYAARSVSDFFRRWHSTLGLWFREYIYIPLGGSRKGTGRTVLNLCIVWALTGLWHGIGRQYLIWAGMLCLLIVNEKLWLGKLLKKAGAAANLYTIFVILLSWVPFATGSIGEMLTLFGRLFGASGKALNTMDYLPLLRDFGVLLLSGAILATPLPRKVFRKVRGQLWFDVILFFLFWTVVYYLATAKQDPFLYFRF